MGRLFQSVSYAKGVNSKLLIRTAQWSSEKVTIFKCEVIVYGVSIHRSWHGDASDLKSGEVFPVKIFRSR